MWQNDLRKAVFVLIYQHLVNSSSVSSESLIEIKQEEVEKLNSLVDFKIPDEAFACFKVFLEKESNLIIVLKNSFKQWHKTYDLIKAIGLTFMLEIENLEPKEQKDIVSKYIRFAQDFTSNDNVKLAHAILVKILTDKSLE